jgi:carbamoyltransferase
MVAAIQEERLLRMKRAELHAGESSLAIQYCLDAAGIKAGDLDAVVNCPTEPADSVWMDLALNSDLRVVRNGTPFFTIGHHLGHAIGAFVQSGFEESAILVVDASGSRWKDLDEEEKGVVSRDQVDSVARDRPHAVCETISLYHAAAVTITPLRKWVFAKRRARSSGMRPFGSLGEMYSSAGKQIFGSYSDGPGKVMGLAPYGNPVIPTSEFFEITPEGEFVFADRLLARFAHDDRWPLRQNEYLDLAASVQEALEHALFYLAAELRRICGSANFCFAGGVALNSVANEKIVRRSIFERHFFMPAAEDSGTAVGAAYYGLWKLTGHCACAPLRKDSAGKRYSGEEISAAIRSAPGLVAERPEDITGRAVRRLASGSILGWFEGGSELGPRALGHRSILCDPRDPNAKDALNSRVKFREGFRPFAPCVLRDSVTDWFDVDPGQCDSPFMMRVMSFRRDKAPLVPAVVHVDGTGRVQTVTPETPRLYALISRFFAETGVPMLVNTSFNIAGEPIVETPGDAIWCFLGSGMDCCVLEDYFVEKQPDHHPILDSVIAVAMDRLTVSIDAGAEGEERPSVQDGPVTFFSSHADSRLVELELTERYPSFQLPPVHTRFLTRSPHGRVKVIANRDLRSLLALMNGRRTGWEILSAVNSNGHVMPTAQFERLIAELRRMSLVSLSSERRRAADAR